MPHRDIHFSYIGDAKDVTTKLGGKVAHRWYQMGVILGSQLSDLEAIRMKNFTPQKSEEEMFKKWLANRGEIATWQRLVDAVGHKAGGDHLRLASKLSKNIDTGNILAGNTTTVLIYTHK